MFCGTAIRLSLIWVEMRIILVGGELLSFLTRIGEELKNPVVCNPTVTKTLTLEVDITGLAINTLLQASHIEGMENLLKEHAAAQVLIALDLSLINYRRNSNLMHQRPLAILLVPTLR